MPWLPRSPVGGTLPRVRPGGDGTAASAPGSSPAASSDLPDAVADQGDPAPAAVHSGRLELVRPDHHVDVRVRLVDAREAAARRRLRTRLAEAGAERDVRRR